MVLIIVAGFAVVLAALLGVRGTSSRRPPMQLFNDMNEQPKYKAQGASAFFADGRAMRTPPAGTLAWQSSPLDQKAYELKTLPLKLDRQLLERGRSLYGIYCNVCHGATGDGTGITVSQYNMTPPASYHQDRLRQATDGYLFQVITEGKGMMAAYGPSLVHPEDRWALVAYLRAIQRTHGTINDVPEANRKDLR